MSVIDGGHKFPKAGNVRDGGHNGGAGTGGGDMDERLRKVEGVIIKLEATIPHLATKADLTSLETTMIKWYIGTSFALVGLAAAISFGAARLLS